MEKNNGSVKTKKEQCGVCSGYGLVKAAIKTCQKCNGIKCMYCNSTGFESQPYERCETCYGDGEIDVEIV